MSQLTGVKLFPRGENEIVGGSAVGANCQIMTASMTHFTLRVIVWGGRHAPRSEADRGLRSQYPGPLAEHPVTIT